MTGTGNYSHIGGEVTYHSGAKGLSYFVGLEACATGDKQREVIVDYRIKVHSINV